MDLNWVIPELIDYVTFRKGPYYADVGDFSSVGTAAFHLVKTLPEGFAKVGIGQDDYYRVLIAHTPKIGPGHLLYAFEANFYNGPGIITSTSANSMGSSSIRSRMAHRLSLLAL